MFDPNEAAAAKAELANGLLQAAEMMTPLYDAADGIRADMAARGWSPTAAEQAALTWLCSAIPHVLTGGQR